MDRLDPVSEKFNPQRRRIHGGKKVDDTASHRIVPRFLDKGGMRIPAPEKLFDQWVPFTFLAGHYQLGVVVQGGSGNNLLQQRFDRQQGHRTVVGDHHPVKRTDPFGGCFAVVCHRFVRQYIVGGKFQQPAWGIRQEKPQVVTQQCPVLRTGHHHQQRAVGRLVDT